MNSFKQKTLFSLALTALFIGGCGGGGSSNQPTTNEVPSVNLTTSLQQIADHSIIPAFKASADAAEGLEVQANNFCQQSDSIQLTRLQSAWKAFSLAWNRTMLYNFGPMNSSDGDSSNDFFAQMLYVESKFLKGNDYTNEVRAEIAQEIANNNPLDKAYFDQLGVTKVGILALESLVFETHKTPYEQNSEALLNDYAQHQRKCQVLQGMARQLSKHTRQFYTNWQNNYRNEFLSGNLSDGNSSIAELLTKAQGQLDYIKSRKLQGGLDAALADYAKENIQSSIDEIHRLVFGAQASDHSLADEMLRLSSSNSAAVNSVETNINQVQNSLKAISGSLKPADLTSLISAIGLLDGNFKREIPNALGVTLGINFNDGD